ASERREVYLARGLAYHTFGYMFPERMPDEVRRKVDSRAVEIFVRVRGMSEERAFDHVRALLLDEHAQALAWKPGPYMNQTAETRTRGQITKGSCERLRALDTAFARYPRQKGEHC